ncbi:MAG: hypothetical protein CMJ78_11515 [Planctomycetaceae bacterium]|nr:hypothetical protein [Planctomycetaceae bacterium]
MDRSKENDAQERDRLDLVEVEERLQVAERQLLHGDVCTVDLNVLLKDAMRRRMLHRSCDFDELR